MRKMVASTSSRMMERNLDSFQLPLTAQLQKREEAQTRVSCRWNVTRSAPVPTRNSMVGPLMLNLLARMISFKGKDGTVSHSLKSTLVDSDLARDGHDTDGSCFETPQFSMRFF